MSNDPVQGLVLARRGLLDALQALERQIGALVLVGAQAVYLWSESIDLGVDPMTLDADVALDLRLLASDPRLEIAMAEAGFQLTKNPGIWMSADGIQIDLLVAAGQAPKGGRRAARIPGHEKRAALKVRGLEAALVDRELKTLGSHDDRDSRSFDLNVAGPMALVLAKTFKIGERAERRSESPARWQRTGKDTVDLLRLLMASDTADLVHRMRKISSEDVSVRTAEQGLSFLRDLFGSRRSEGAQLLAHQAEDIEQGAQWAESAVQLTKELFAALGAS